MRENDRVGKSDGTHRINKLGMVYQPKRILIALPTPTSGLLIVPNKVVVPLHGACLLCHVYTCTLRCFACSEWYQPSAKGTGAAKMRIRSVGFDRLASASVVQGIQSAIQGSHGRHQQRDLKGNLGSPTTIATRTKAILPKETGRFLKVTSKAGKRVRRGICGMPLPRVAQH